MKIKTLSIIGGFLLFGILPSASFAGNSYLLRWKVPQNERLRYVVSRSIFMPASSYLPEKVFGFPTFFETIITLENIGNDHIGFETIVRNIKTETEDDAVVLLESVFLADPDVAIEGLVIESFQFDRAGNFLHEFLDENEASAQKKYQELGYNDELSHEMALQILEFQKRNFDYLFLLNSIFIQLPNDEIKVGDYWDISGACNKEGYTVPSEYGDRKFDRSGSVHFADVTKNDQGQEIAVLVYIYDEKYSVDYEDDGVQQVSCGYSGIHHFNITQGMWEKVEGIFSTNYPDFIGLPKAHKIQIYKSKIAQNYTISDDEIERINEKYKEYSFSFPEPLNIE